MKWVALGLLVALPTYAETIKVQTGEHTNFSRVVLSPARITAWKLVPTEQGYNVNFSRDDITFDTTNAFDLIPKNRIESMRAQGPGGTLELILAPRMVARSFETREGAVVIDILSEEEAKLLISLDAEGQLAPPFDVGRQSPVRNASRQPLSSLGASQQVQADFFWNGVLDGLPPAQAAQTTSDTPAVMLEQLASNPRVALVEEQLLRQLSRAASQGLVRVEPTKQAPPPSAGDEDQSEPLDQISQETGVPSDIAAKQQEADARTEQSDLAYSMKTSLDREVETRPSKHGYTDEGLSCLRDDALRPQDWATDSSPVSQIAETRSVLLGEFDTVNQEEAVKLAKLYLSFGFGAEAEAVLDAFAIKTEEVDLLRYVARVLDSRSVDASSPILTMSGCEGPGAMWAVLGSQKDLDTDTINVEAVQRSFAALPQSLRNLIVDPLVERLIMNGEVATARIIRGIAERVARDDMPMDMIDARISLARGDTENATENLKTVIKDNGAGAVDAMVMLIDAQVGANETVGDDLVEQVSAMAFEHRMTPRGPNIERAFILAASANGQYARAVDALTRWPEDEPGSREEISLKVYRALLQRAGDVDFLRFSIENAALWGALSTDENLSLETAKRFISLGYFDQASLVLEAELKLSDQLRLLRAEAFVGLGDGQAALDALDGLTNDQVGSLRGEALALVAQPIAAAEAFALSGESGEASRQAWKAGAPDLISEFGSDQQKEAIDSLASTNADNQQSAEGPLGRAEVLIDGSSRMRSALRSLLDPKI